MGSRKRIAAENRKAAVKQVAFAKLNECPTSPRKMRLVADMIRGKRVDIALAMLKFSTKEASTRLEKLLLSALANWQAKNEGKRIEDQELVVSEVHVDSGRQLKRLRPAPQGRGYRIRKRSNHVTLVVDTKAAAMVESTENNNAN
jgi:large subunit ribosomal protein L22